MTEVRTQAEQDLSADLLSWSRAIKRAVAEDGSVNRQVWEHISWLMTRAANVVTSSEQDEKEAYEIGVRDGHEDAIQNLDIETGGDGEFYGSTLPGGTVDVPVMKQRIVQRFDDQLAALKFVSPGLLVLRNMCARVGLKLGEAKAVEMINEVRRVLCEEPTALLRTADRDAVQPSNE